MRRWQQADSLIKKGELYYSTNQNEWSKEKPSFTNAGTYTVYAKQDVTVGGVTTTLKASARVVINKAEVTLKSKDLSKEYDGTALVNGSTALETETGWAEGEGADYTFTGSRTLVGSSANAFSYTLRSNTSKDNYEITKTEGALTVNPYDEAIIAKVSGTKATYVYDGTTYSVSGFDVEFEKPNGTPDSLSKTSVVLKPNKTAKASGTDVGDYKMNLEVSDFEWNDANFSNVTISIAEDGL